MSVSVLSGFVGSIDRRFVSTRFGRPRQHLVRGMSAECVDQDTADQVGYENNLKRHHRGRFLTGEDVDGAEAGSDFRDLLDADDGIMCSCDTGDVKFCPLCDHPDLEPGEFCICNVPVELYGKARLMTKRKAVAYDDDGRPIPGWCAIIVKLTEARGILKALALSERLFDN